MKPLYLTNYIKLRSFLQVPIHSLPLPPRRLDIPLPFNNINQQLQRLHRKINHILRPVSGAGVNFPSECAFGGCDGEGYVAAVCLLVSFTSNPGRRRSNWYSPTS